MQSVGSGELTYGVPLALPVLKYENSCDWCDSCDSWLTNAECRLWRADLRGWLGAEDDFSGKRAGGFERVFFLQAVSGCGWEYRVRAAH